ncbi:hypothetical protein JM654_07290 [Microbacterium oxydans]|nr:hypothetical protein [Microbacterium oxydans]
MIGMTNEIDAEIDDLARKARELASRIPFADRANILRTVAYEVRQAVKFDPTTNAGAPQGREWELEGLGKVCDAAENYYFEARTETRR